MVADHADYHMATPMDPNGPIGSADASTDTNQSKKDDPLPYEAPPADHFPDVREPQQRALVPRRDPNTAATPPTDVSTRRYDDTMAKVSVSRAVLAWAMNQAASSPADLAEATGRPQTTVLKWLSGDEDPHKGDLLKLASYLGRPPEFFFMREPPREDPIPAYRRSTFGGADAPRSARESAAVRRAENIREMASWLAQNQGADRVEWPDVSNSPAEQASRFRTFLDWSIRDDQVKATSKAATFRRLRQSVEALGVVVIVEDVGLSSSRGFSLADPYAPLIFINDAARLASVRTYTLLHEVAHLMRGETVLHHRADRAEEKYCERFAAEFLLPKADFLDYVNTWRGKKFYGPGDLDDIRLISNRFKASWHTVAIRLKELGLADDNLVIAVSNGGEVDSGWSNEPRTRSRMRVSEFGYTYPRLLADAIDERRISELDARRYLRLTKKDEFAGLRTLLRAGA